MTEAPSIKEALEPCPFCGGPAGCVAFEFVTCLSAQPLGEEICPGKQIKAPVDRDDPTYSTAWNTRATLQPSGERREAIARMRRSLDQWSGCSPEAISKGSEAQMSYFVADAKHDIALLASGLVRDEAGWQPIDTAPKDGTRFLWSCGDDKMSVIHWPEYELCFEGGYWMPLPAPPLRSARDGGAES